MTRETFAQYHRRVVAPKHRGDRAYEIHDNGGVPFVVYVGRDVVAVYTYPPSSNGLDADAEVDRTHYVVPVARWPGVKRVFVPPRPPGNTLLVQLSTRRHVFIGSRLIQFEAPEPIVEYRSPVQNSDTPYPFARSERFVYFFDSVTEFYELSTEFDDVLGAMVDRTLFPKASADPHDVFYSQLNAKRPRDLKKTKHAEGVWPLRRYQNLTRRRTEAENFFPKIRAEFLSLQP